MAVCSNIIIISICIWCTMLSKVGPEAPSVDVRPQITATLVAVMCSGKF